MRLFVFFLFAATGVTWGGSPELTFPRFDDEPCSLFHARAAYGPHVEQLEKIIREPGAFTPDRFTSCMFKLVGLHAPGALVPAIVRYIESGDGTLMPAATYNKARGMAYTLSLMAWRGVPEALAYLQAGLRPDYWSSRVSWMPDGGTLIKTSSERDRWLSQQALFGLIHAGLAADVLETMREGSTPYIDIEESRFTATRSEWLALHVRENRCNATSNAWDNPACFSAALRDEREERERKSKKR